MADVNDIVERLRQEPRRRASETEDQAKIRRQAEREEAADEIERLRNALETIARSSRAKARQLAYRALGYPEPHEIMQSDQ